MVMVAGCETATTLWHADADNDVDSGDKTLFMDKATDGLPTSRLSIVPDPNSQYGDVYKAQLFAADINDGEKRAEWNEAFLGDGETELNLWGEDGPTTSNVYIGWRSMFGGDLFLSGGNNEGNYLQWKGDSSCGGPAVGMTVSQNRLTLRTLDGDADKGGVERLWVGPLMTTMMDGQWHDFVMRVEFNKGSSGEIQLWLDGNLQLMANGTDTFHGPTVCPLDTKVFPKWGVYNMDVGIGQGPIHWVESPRIGVTYDGVVPR